MAKVGIGVGHGGKDPGAIGNGLREADINLVIGLAMNDELVRHGVETYMTRMKDEDDPLSDEIKEINAFSPDIALDIHINSAAGTEGDGFEVYHSINKNGLGKRLAELIEAEVLELGQNSRGVKTRTNSQGKDYYGFVREIKCPSIIAEGAFINNPDDISILNTIEEQKAFGVAYAKGVLKYFGIPWKGSEPDYKALYEAEKAKVDQAIKVLGGVG